MTRGRTLVARFAVTLTCAVTLVGACSQAEPDPTAVGEFDPGFVPRTLLGFDVSPEPLGDTLATVERSRVDAVALFGVRDGERLVATLQVSRLTGDDADTEDFHAAVLEQIGARRPRPADVGGRRAFLTAGSSGSLAVWFQDRFMLVLGTREEFERPRALLRAALAIEAGS